MSKKKHTKRRLTRKEQRGSSKAEQVEKTTGTGLLSAIVVAVVSFILVYIFIPEPEKALAKTKALQICIEKTEKTACHILWIHHLQHWQRKK